MCWNWAQTHAAEGDLALILMPLPSGCWGYRLYHCVKFWSGVGGVQGLVHVRQVLALHPHTPYFTFWFLNYFFCVCVYGCFACMCDCVPPVPDGCGSQKRVLAGELELGQVWAAVWCRELSSSGRAAGAPPCWAVAPAPCVLLSGGSHSVDVGSLGAVILLPVCPTCWGDRSVPPHQYLLCVLCH